VHFEDEPLRARFGPVERAWRTEPGLRDAAVLVPLVRRPHGDVLVFTLRRPDLTSHPGQVSFPGGAREEGEDPVACALREAQEEIGLVPEDARVLGRLPDRVSIAGFLVAPIVARVEASSAWVPLEREVAEVFELPVAPMLDAARWSFRPSTHPLARFARIPYVEIDGRTVWGLTGIVLRDFVRSAAGFDPAADEPGYRPGAVS
jgi:8-oxo-dGTP pyrophosphatase MutT (NUDIX family)